MEYVNRQSKNERFAAFQHQKARPVRKLSALKFKSTPTGRSDRCTRDQDPRQHIECRSAGLIVVKRKGRMLSETVSVVDAALDGAQNED